MEKLIKFILYFFSLIILIIFSNNFLFAQWEKIEISDPDFQNVYWLDVFFLNSNANYGWICGFGGNVMRTTDGGNTWSGTKIQNMVIDTIYRNGKIIGYDTNYVNAVNQLESIQFVDSLVGYTSGEGKAFRSTDGGQTWKIISKPKMKIWGLYFVNRDIGMLIGGGCDDPQEFYRTEDGGKTWSNFEAYEPMSGLSDLILYSADGLGYASSSGLIWRTNNGGKTWSIYSVSGGRDWQEELTNIGKSFLVPFDIGCWGGSPEKSGGLRMSVDNGRNWREYNTNAEMFGAFLLDSLRGWGCGNNNSIYYTSDGGKTWELKNCGLEPATSLDDLWFINDTLGFVVGRGIYRTYFYDTTYSEIAKDKPNMICQGDSLLLKASDNYPYHKWSTGDTSKNVYVNKTGWYYLSSFNNLCDYVYEDSVYVNMAPIPDFQIMTNKSYDFCEGDSILLWVNISHQDIYWSTGESTDTIVVKKSGEYKVSITDKYGCEYSSGVVLTSHPLPDVEIEGLGKSVFCIGDSLVLRTKKEYEEYYWFESSKPDSMISNRRTYVAKSSGTYFVAVKDKWGCESISDYYLVKVLMLSNNLSIAFNSANKIVDFDTLALTGRTCQTIRIVNVSNRDFELNDVYLKHNIEFSVPQGQFPYFISSGDSIDLMICYRPIHLVLDRDTLVINDTCRPHIIPLKGVGGVNKYISKGKNKNCDADIIFKTLDLVSDEYFEGVKIYPNPASTRINVDVDAVADSMENINIALYTVTGIKKAIGNIYNVRRNEYQGKNILRFSTSLEIFDLESGIYFIEVSIGGSIGAYKVSIIK